MKTKIAALATLILSLFIIAVNAQWSALNSGYAVTTNYHGEDVMPGTLITATAGTTDPNVQNVTFKWKYPNETVAFTDPKVPVWSNSTKWPDENGTLIYYAQSSYTPDETGDWGVQALFNAPGGHLQDKESDIIKIRATSFNSIPEIPIIGTAGAITMMLLSLGFYKRRQKNQQ